jgi:hypothetical protein
VLERVGHVVFQRRHHALDEEFFLRGEVTVEGRLRAADVSADVRHRGPVEPLRPEQSIGAAQNCLSFAVAFAHKSPFLKSLLDRPVHFC